MLLGDSVQHRAIIAVELGEADSLARTLVVGCIHGNETAGIAIATELADGAPPAEADLWVIPNLNPDGVAVDRRGNADSVDLNRNFPYNWQPSGPSGTASYAGPRPLSEPEGTLAATLVERLRPRLTIYYHQAQAVIDDSEGPRGAENGYAQAVGLPLRPLIDYPGSAVGWQDAILGPTAFVVELPAGPLPAPRVRAHNAVVRAILPTA